MQRPWVSSPSYDAAVQFLVRKRHEGGLSQRELAERLGKPRSFISKVEGKERRLDIVEFLAYAAALGASPGGLMEELSTFVPRPVEF